MYWLKTAFLFLGTAAALTVPRATINVNTVLADITNLDNTVKTLIGTLNNLNLFTALVMVPTLQANLNSIHSTNRQGYANALAGTSKFSSADSTSIINKAKSTLVVDNPAACKLIKSKKPLFDAAFISGQVLSGLQELLADHTSYSAALVKNCSPDTVAAANAVVATITDALQDAINFYS